MPVQQLPPGKYVLRAILSSATGASIKTLTRGFEIAPPKVLLTSAEGLGNVSVDAELFLPVDDATMTPAFQRDAAVDETTLAPFRERVTPSVKAAFDQGVVFLAAGDFTKAELSFKSAIEPDVDSTAPLAFLAASFAAAGKDQRGRERVADRAGRRHRLPADLPVAQRRAAAHARLRRRARDPRGGGRQVADRRALHQAAGDALRDVRPGTRGGPHARALPRRSAGRSRRLFPRRAVALHRPRRRRGRPQPRRRSQARPRVRGRLPASTRAAGGPRQAVGGLPRHEK